VHVVMVMGEGEVALQVYGPYTTAGEAEGARSTIEQLLAPFHTGASVEVVPLRTINVSPVQVPHICPPVVVFPQWQYPASPWVSNPYAPYRVTLSAGPGSSPGLYLGDAE